MSGVLGLIKSVRAVLLAVVLCLGVLPSSGLAIAQDLDRGAAATEAYRAGDLSTARVLWQELLANDALDQGLNQRARLCYNLGNLALRESRDLDAVAWYTAALRLRPRDADTWENLELARLNAGLEAADRGDLKSTVGRILSSWTPAESSLLALLGALPLALALAYEALRGGRRARVLGFLGLVIWLVALAPWVRQRFIASARESMIVAPKGSAARAEPRPDAARVEKLEAGLILPLLDEFPGWKEMRIDEKRRGWVKTEDLFVLKR